ncbi:hypothetical protein VNI00_019467 [Paramarasmius palmivorus]|uniref:Uncharacterized protein n=1 Tax=Paramarasmius palmivorus TaxID=297713 RepID=A0AAW0ALA0_9AGAR
MSQPIATPTATPTDPSPQPPVNPDASSKPKAKQRGKGRHECPFGGQLDDALNAAFKEFGAELKKHNLHLGKNGSKHSDPESLNQWLKEKLDTIKCSARYKDLTQDKAVDYDKSLRDKFKNWRNNVFIPRSQQEVISAHLAELQSGDGSSSHVRKPGAAHTLLSSLRDPATAKDLFVRENRTAIDALQAKLLVEDSSIKGNGGGARAKAAASLWRQADQESYAKRVAQGESIDITKNRESMLNALFECLKDLCTSGQLGHIEAFLLLGYRKESDGKVQMSRIHASSSQSLTPEDKFLQRAEQKDLCRQVDEEWKGFIGKKIPLPSRRFKLVDHLEYNTDDIPVIKPSLRLRDVAPSSLELVLKNLLQALYYKARAVPDVPFEEIQNEPSQFFDTTIHGYLSTLPTLNPQVLDPSKLYEVAVYLQKLPAPFVFLGRPGGAEEATSPVDPCQDNLRPVISQPEVPVKPHDLRNDQQVAPHQQLPAPIDSTQDPPIPSSKSPAKAVSPPPPPQQPYSPQPVQKSITNNVVSQANSASRPEDPVATHRAADTNVSQKPTVELRDSRPQSPSAMQSSTEDTFTESLSRASSPLTPPPNSPLPVRQQPLKRKSSDAEGEMLEEPANMETPAAKRQKTGGAAQSRGKWAQLPRREPSGRQSRLAVKTQVPQPPPAPPAADTAETSRGGGRGGGRGGRGGRKRR